MPDTIDANAVRKPVVEPLTGAEFQRKLRWLVFHSWNFPPIFGLGMIMLLGVLTPEQILGILITPLEPSYIILWLLFSVWFFPYMMRPVSRWLDDPVNHSQEQAIAAVKRFPLLFWSVFIFYLVLAPFSVIGAAEIYTDFVSSPVTLFRIELVALIVSIIVGLPIFFLMFDLFGRALGKLELQRPILAVRTKVFLIGALIPLLIDTMLVQYYWTRTGHFNTETVVVWAFLELLAIGGSLIFAHSFGQSLTPLQTYGDTRDPLMQTNVSALRATSTDELGVLTGDYRRLLDSLRAKREIERFNNRLLRSTSLEIREAGVFREIVNVCHDALGADLAFVMMFDEASHELVCVIQTGEEYQPDGLFHLSMSEASLAVWSYLHKQTIALDDCSTDERVNPQMRERFGVHGAIATPMQYDNSIEGVLMAITRGDTHYGPYELALIEGIAREAVQSLNTLRLREERVQADIARREQEAQVRLLMDTTEEGIYGVDINGRCTFINRAALAMLGYRENEVVGEEIHNLIHHTLPDGTPYPKEKCRVRLATLAGTDSHSDDEVHWRADGSSFPVEYWSRPIRRGDETIGTVVSFVDITERKAAADELAVYQAQLENMVEWRTRELREAQDSLIRQEKLATLGQLTATVSHELRNPLAAMASSLYIIKKGGAKPEQIDASVRRIETNIQRCDEIIDELLDFTRMARIDMKKLDIDRWLVQTLHELDIPKSVEVQVNKGADHAEIYFDPNRLRRVMVNLVSNACHAMADPDHPDKIITGAQLVITTSVSDDRASIEVTDNGIGMNEDVLAHLFEPLYSTKGFGVGLGMPAIEQIIKQHEGGIDVVSTPGQGTTITFWLPR